MRFRLCAVDLIFLSSTKRDQLITWDCLDLRPSRSWSWAPTSDQSFCGWRWLRGRVACGSCCTSRRRAPPASGRRSDQDELWREHRQSPKRHPVKYFFCERVSLRNKFLVFIWKISCVNKSTFIILFKCLFSLIRSL